jgi:succinate-acetate transporter protein
MIHTANASALGYGAFALTLWLNSMTPAAWFAPSDAGGLLPLLTSALGGCVLAIAGILQWQRGHVLDTLLFVAFAAYWWVATLYPNGAPATAGWLGWYDMVWALLAFCVWIAALRDGVARMLFTLGLCLSLFTAALAQWAHLDALTILGGYLGLVTAVVGISIAAAEAVNETRGHTVLPLGESTAIDAPPKP